MRFSRCAPLLSFRRPPARAGPQLFTPFKVGKLDLANRIVIAPMCQYSAVDGCMTDWHLIHLGHLALSGAALMMLEVAAVTPEGRITHGDVGLYDDASEAAIARTLESVAPLVGHADRHPAVARADARRRARCPEGGGQIAPGADKGWQTEALPAGFLPVDTPPTALDREGLARLRDAFAAAATRAARLGIDAIQLHAAHGYLLHQFLSPLANHRDDDHGGSLENRMRFPLEVYDAVRAAFPADRPVTMRVSGTDWSRVAGTANRPSPSPRRSRPAGAMLIHVSSGALSPDQQIPVGPSYQVPLARQVKQAVGIPVVAVGLITDYEQAEAIIDTGDADLVALARTLLYDPRWPWHAAAHLGGHVKAPNQYLRSQPRQCKDLFQA
ncbi:oxidoreductase [Sphingomonas aerolata]|uniref:oxidoreductase n=1 Tax=Sphingomonas aerolata TaxID=185951 RepID=UPI002FDF5BB3